MIKRALGTVFLACLSLLFCPSALKAGGRTTGGPVTNYAKAVFIMPIADTTPLAKQAPANAVADTKDALIKEVPKARKQEKPIAVIPVTVKPVIVKPKVIIKPIIKIH